MSNNMNETRALKILMKRIGALAVRINDNPKLSYDVGEMEALLWIISQYQELKLDYLSRQESDCEE